MLTRDVLGRRSGKASEVRLGRLFTLVVAAATFGLWRVTGASIFDVATVAFSGYVTLVPVLFLAVRWRRFTATGALASILAGNGVYALCLWQGGSLVAARQASFLGLLPVFWAFLAACLAGVLASRLGPPPDRDLTERAFGDASPSTPSARLLQSSAR